MTILVLLRDAVRQSRGWSLYASRAAFVGATALVCGTTLFAAMTKNADVASYAFVARALFRETIALGLAAALILVPLLVAAAVTQEGEDRTFDLMALTRVSARALLAGTVGARLLAVATAFASALPIVAIVLGFGGASPSELLAGAASVAFVAALMAAVATLVAVEAKGPLVPALMTTVWGVGALVVAPWVRFGQTSPVACPGGGCTGVEGPAAVSPVYGWVVGKDLLHGVGLWTPALLGVVVLAPAALRVAAGGSGRTARSAWWDVRLLQTAALLPWLATAAAGFVFLRAWTASTLPRVDRDVGLWVLFVGAASAVWLRLALAAVAGGGGAAVWRLGPASGRRFLRWPWPAAPDPVSWQHLLTRGAGTRRAVLGLHAAWLAGMLFLVTRREPSILWLSRPDVGAVAIGSAALLAVFAAAVTATAIVVEERRDARVELLLTTTMPRTRLALAHLLAVAASSLPSLALALAVLVARADWTPASFHDPQTAYLYTPFGPAWLPALPEVRVVFLVLWIGAAWSTLALGFTAVAWLVPRPWWAWVVNVGGLMASPCATGFVAAVLALLFDVLGRPDPEAFKGLLLLVFPFVGVWPMDATGTPVELVLSTVAWAAAAVGLFAVVVGRLRYWGMSPLVPRP